MKLNLEIQRQLQYDRRNETERCDAVAELDKTFLLLQHTLNSWQTYSNAFERKWVAYRNGMTVAISQELIFEITSVFLPSLR
jgi:hypothetical protein